MLGRDFVSLAVASVTSLELHRAATAAQLAASFGLRAVWSSNEPTRLLLPSISNSNRTADYLYSNWTLEDPLRPAGSEVLSFVADPFSLAEDELALAVAYDKGKKGGTQFWSLPWGNVSGDGTLSSGAEPRTAVLSYKVAFPNDWDFVKGGKLPGLYGGADTGQCTGGDRQLSCFSARLMWRPQGAGEVYAYAPQYEAMCKQADVMCDNNRYGLSLSRGAWTFKRGEWTQITQLVALNTPPIANGLLVTYVNDSLVLSQTGLVWRTDERVKLSRVLFSTFFGGSSSSYLPAKDQVAYFKDLQVWSSDLPSNTTGPVVNATLYTPTGEVSLSSSSRLGPVLVLSLSLHLILALL